MKSTIDEKILNQNAIFAHFMGGKPVGNGFEFSIPPTSTNSSRLFHIEDIGYHSSWDWFMPLWYKLCEKMHVHEDKNAETDMLSEMMYAICGNDIEAAWNIAIEAIAKVEKLEKDQQE